MPHKIPLSSFCFFGLLTLSLASPLLAHAAPLWGAYAGWQPSEFTAFQDKVGQKMNYLAAFIHWGNENQFPADLSHLAAANNQTLVIYWEAMDYNVTSPQTDSRFSYDQILSGKYDSYLQSFAAAAKTAGTPVILIPFEEMNGDWYPWSITQNGNTPAKHVAAYRHIHSFFTNVPNVKFGWAINNDSVPDTQVNDPMSYFPGVDCVDYVGVDGFNFGNPWQTFSEVFDRPLANLKTLGKPLMIFSMASSDGAAKSAWIQDAASKINNHPEITGWIWFNENKERDWRVWSDADSLRAFQNYLIPSADITPTPTASRPSLSPTSIPTATPTISRPTLSPTATPAPTRRPKKRRSFSFSNWFRF